MNHEIPDDFEHGGAVWADGERTAQSRGDSGEFITAWAARWNFQKTTDAMGALAEAQEQFKSENGSDTHVAAVRAQKFYRDWALAIKSFKGPRSFAFDCACFALGWKDIVGCQTQIALATKWRCTKANVEKCLGAIQQLCGIPETAEQRDKVSRKKMSVRRKGQLRGKV